MKQLRLLLLFTMLLMPILVWAEPFTSKYGKFTVTFPSGVGEPQQSVDTYQSAAGPATDHTVQLYAGSRLYECSYGDISDKKIQKVGSTALLKERKDLLRKSLTATVEVEAAAKLQNRPALSFRLTSHRRGVTTYGRVLVVLDGKRLYTIVYLSSGPADCDSPDANNFLASFKILS